MEVSTYMEQWIYSNIEENPLEECEVEAEKRESKPEGQVTPIHNISS